MQRVFAPELFRRAGDGTMVGFDQSVFSHAALAPLLICCRSSSDDQNQRCKYVHVQFATRRGLKTRALYALVNDQSANLVEPTFFHTYIGVCAIFPSL